MKKIKFFGCFLLFQSTFLHAQWNLSGNAITSSNFLGSTNNIPLIFKVGSQKAGYLTYDSNKAITSYGYLALKNVNASGNSAFGYNALNIDSTGINNTAVGAFSLMLNKTGLNNTANGYSTLRNNSSGSNNSANGYKILYSNTTGSYNTVNGYFAMYYNISGSYNTSSGAYSLYDNLGGNYNTASGCYSMRHNTVGILNTASGYYSLNSDTAGSDNTAAGAYSLYSTNGNYNTAYGAYALKNSAATNLNTAIGYDALFSNTTGSVNTAIGANSGPNISNLINTTALGSGAIPTASYQVRVGDASITSIGGQVGWTSFSDERIKNNIKENVPGLAFINLLHPVTYHFNMAKENELLAIKNNADNKANADIEKMSFTGFLAQDVDKAAQKINYDFSGVDKSGSLMALRYSDFVVPLVKAVQELSSENDALKKNYDAKIDALQKQIEDLKSMIVSGQSIANNQQSTIVSSASLSQNIPNPFGNTTIINYALPQKFSSAQIIFTDQNGKIIKQVNINNVGKGTLNVDATTLAAGAYNYSLMVDGKLINTKTMVIAK